jgi:CxxC motif-containing protein
MRELTCIVCPIGCRLSVEDAADGELLVTGNRCPRGAAYAVEEIRAPKRVVTATCRLGSAGACADNESSVPTVSSVPGGAAEGAGAAVRARARRRGLCDPRRLPVKSSAPCPKERIDELLADIYAASATPPVKRGDVVIPNWKGTGIDVVAARALD